ncbi:MAG: S41 family peptidase [Myxococcota bacterium]
MGHVEKVHLAKPTLDDAFSKRVYERFMTRLGAEYLLTVQDLKQFEAEETETSFDEIMLENDLKKAFGIYGQIQQRAVLRSEIVLDELAKIFADKGQPKVRPVTLREKPEPAETMAILEQRWRDEIHDAVSKRLGAGDEPGAIEAQLRNNYLVYEKLPRDWKANDAFDALMDSYLAAIDPHSAFDPPIDASLTLAEITGNFAGIGVVLNWKFLPNQNSRGGHSQEEYVSYPTVASLSDGGPADQSRQFKPGDIILGVGSSIDNIQDSGNVPQNDLIGRIRGSIGTTVYVRLKTGDEPPRTVGVVRKAIVTPGAAVDSGIVTVDRPGGAKARIGVVHLPAFFAGSGAFAKTASGEVLRALKELQQQGIDGFILDLRGNPGGLLTEAVKLPGLFSGQEPVAVVRDAAGKEDVYIDPDPATHYSGPMAVFVDGGSASASEITADALKDWGRALVLSPHPHSYGKGSVQTVYDSIMTPEGPILVRLTTAGFYGVSGKSNTGIGVIPDIQLRDITDGNYGESALPYVLKLKKIGAQKFTHMHRIPDLTQYKKNFKPRDAAEKGPTAVMPADGRALTLQERIDQGVDLDLLDAAQVLSDVMKLTSAEAEYEW